MVELRGFEPLTFCMPCSTIPSGTVALGPVTALQSSFDVWGRRARSGEVWGRWDLVWDWVTGPTRQWRGAARRAPRRVELRERSYVAC